MIELLDDTYALHVTLCLLESVERSMHRANSAYHIEHTSALKAEHAVFADLSPGDP